MKSKVIIQKITKLLIANRGEIACRVIQTANRLGIETVAVYSDADRLAKHVLMADSAIHIGKSSAVESYLNQDKIIEAALKSGADAIHPGYGFLSENAKFAQKCLDAKLIFIGPNPSAILSMGSKDEAKSIMKNAGVPILPGYQGDLQSPEALEKAALEIGLPIMIKAVAGGGGKGMRIVHIQSELNDAILSAKRESMSAFGNDTLMLEKYLESARHIEVQVFADHHGQVVHLYERDCSIQRRYQKIIEEAPALHIPDDIKSKLYKTAIDACKAIGYCGAGTLEYLYQDNAFYFMEMNTRLQVEHPVTEGITGLDLVEWQIKVAEGYELPLTQSQIQLKGHAIEVRIYAEDPSQEFKPAIGKILKFYHPNRRQDNAIENGQEPESRLDYRLDTGVQEEDDIGIFYDPMIAKLIVCEKDRDTSVRKLHQVLMQTEVVGLKTNLSLLRQISAEKNYQKANYSTRYLDKHPKLLEKEPFSAKQLTLGLLAGFVGRYLYDKNILKIKSAALNESHSPWFMHSGWQLNQSANLTYYYQISDQNVETVTVEPITVSHRTEETLTITFSNHGKKPFKVNACKMSSEEDVHFNMDEMSHHAKVTPLATGLHVYLSETGFNLDIEYPSQKRQELSQAKAGDLVSPLPGVITQILVKAGQSVVPGQKLLIMEAMKMEHTVTAFHACKIIKVLYQKGDQIQDGVPLFEFEAIK